MTGPLRVVAAAALATLLAAAPAAASRPPAHVLVAVARASAAPAGALRVGPLAPGAVAYAARVPRGQSAARYAAWLRGRPGVLAAQPDQRLRATQAQSPGFCATAPPEQVVTTIPAALSAQDVSAPTTKPIAILDTGVSAAVPELAGRIVNPFNALNGSADADDADGHGTQVAGAAAGAPGLVAGASPTSPVMPIKIFQANGSGTAQALVKGIERAVATGAGVIDISGAGPQEDATKADTGVVRLAIASAFARGVLVVVAAGNDGTNKPYVPGDLPHTLTVGSGTRDGGRDAFSNNGPWVDVVGPGQGLTLPMPASVCSTGYGPASGTSFSAPAVAGAAALVQALRPGLPAQQLFDLLRGSARDMATAGRDDDTGYGLVDVAAAVRAPLPKKADQGELDDDVVWVTAGFARLHPVLLRSTRTAKVSARVSSAKDPVDVYRVHGVRGKAITATATGTPGALLDVSIWDRTTGGFDISGGVDKHLLASTNGYTRSPVVSLRVKRTGTYFVSVDTADVPDPQDEGTTSPADSAEAARPDEPYTLTVSRAGQAKRRAESHRRHDR